MLALQMEYKNTKNRYAYISISKAKNEYTNNKCKSVWCFGRSRLNRYIYDLLASKNRDEIVLCWQQLKRKEDYLSNFKLTI